MSNSATTTNNNSNKSVMDEEAINNLRQYLRIKSVHPNINYDECVQFLKTQANSLELPYHVYYIVPDKPIFVITWTGKEPTLPSIWLNSHMDVVPVYEELWTHKPFDAHMDADGNIYARGIQDTKALGIQYLEAIKRLRKQGAILKRTVHVAFVPDEEVNGINAMKDFPSTNDFRMLNVGFAMDESGASPTENFKLYYGERFIWQLRVHCPGQQGHGSLLLPHPPGDKIGVIINKFNSYRAQELKKLTENSKLDVGDVLTINLTRLQGGVQANVVPPEFVATFDIRIPSTVDTEKLQAEMNEWCKQAGEGVWIEFTNKEVKTPNTILDDSNKFWVAFKKAIDDLKIKIDPKICAEGTDASYLRQVGIPALGFSPMNNTILLEHDNNEYLNANVFLKGIDILMKILQAVGNVN